MSRNSEFHNLVNSILDISIDDKDNTLAKNENVNELISAAVGKIGENIVLRRSSYLNGNIHSYVHNSVSQGLGKIGVLLKLNTDSDKVAEIGKNLCMHIAALNPKSISEEDLSEELVVTEKEIIKQQLKDSGKPDNILEKMLEGKIKKFYEENTLLGQKFVIDPALTVDDYIKQSAEKNNCKISVEQFIRYELGS